MRPKLLKYSTVTGLVRATALQPARTAVLLFFLLFCCLASKTHYGAEEAGEKFSMTGWATAGKGTTGGEGGAVVIVSTPRDLVHQIRKKEPLVIKVQGLIELGDPFHGYKSDGQYHVESNKTIIGLGEDAGIRRGEFRLTGVSNVIIRNMSFLDAPDTAVAITHRTTHVWIDHNNFSGSYDGLIDITRASDYITVSWNRFFNQTKVSLIGAGDRHIGDRGRNRVTFHHNWFMRTNERHPRVRFGRVHLFNNFYDQVNSGISIGVEAQIVSEANFFHSPRLPYVFQDNKEQPGFMKDSGSVFGRGGLPPLREDGVEWSPSDYYDYVLDEPHEVPERVRSFSGVGIIDF